MEVSIHSFSQGYNPELPVLESAVLHIFIELLIVVKTKPPHRYPCRRQLLLTQAGGKKALLGSALDLCSMKLVKCSTIEHT